MKTGQIHIPKEHQGITPKPATYVVDDRGCWICTSHVFDKGYARIRRKRKMLQLHRFVYELLVGAIPDNLVVRHKCDNRACINPDHLETGTLADNINDRHIRGRDARVAGSANGNSSLTEDKAMEILHNPGTPLSHFAKKFGVYRSTISQIRNRRTWKHLNSAASA